MKYVKAEGSSGLILEMVKPLDKARAKIVSGLIY